jgi:hypothetical protein
LVSKHAETAGGKLALSTILLGAFDFSDFHYYFVERGHYASQLLSSRTKLGKALEKAIMCLVGTVGQEMIRGRQLMKA